MKKTPVFKKAVDLIIGCTPEECGKLDVGTVAKILNVTPSYLSGDFKHNMGFGLKQFLIREKIIRARFLLKQNNNLSVKDIASIMGYSTTDYFIKVFKNETGTTPGKFRKIDRGFYGLKDRRKFFIRSSYQREERRKSYKINYPTSDT